MINIEYLDAQSNANISDMVDNDLPPRPESTSTRLQYTLPHTPPRHPQGSAPTFPSFKSGLHLPANAARTMAKHTPEQSEQPNDPIASNNVPHPEVAPSTPQRPRDVDALMAEIGISIHDVNPARTLTSGDQQSANLQSRTGRSGLDSFRPDGMSSPRLLLHESLLIRKCSPRQSAAVEARVIPQCTLVANQSSGESDTGAKRWFTRQ